MDVQRGPATGPPPPRHGPAAALDGPPLRRLGPGAVLSARPSLRRGPAVALDGPLLRRGLAAALCGLAGVAGCDAGSPDPAPTPAPSAVSSPAGPSPAATPVGRAVDAAGDRLVLTPEPLVRSGETVVLTVRARLDRAATGNASSVVSRHFSATQSSVFDAGRLVDTRARRVYLVAESPGGDCVCTGSLRLGPGDTGTLQAAFAGVPASAGRLSVMLPYAGVFADVPIVAGPVPTPGDGEPLEPAGAVSHAADLGARAERLDVGLRSRRTPDRMDLDLDTDVLFRVDSARLTPGATRTIAAAVADISGAGAGPLTITGHTDDTGTAPHNQSLSRRRAEAVAAALRPALPDARWPKTVAARGETQPAVPNDSAAHRSLNRRVTVSFRATDPPVAPQPTAPPGTATPGGSAPPGATTLGGPATPAPPTTVTSGGPGKPAPPNAAAPGDPGKPAPPNAAAPGGPGKPAPPGDAAPLPRAEGRQGTARDGVEITLPLHRGIVRFTAGPATVRGAFLQVDLLARNAGDDKATILDYLGQGVFTVRNEFDPYAPYGAGGVRLLAGGTASYGLDYELRPGDHRCLCDRLLNQAVPPGSTRLLALWFPAPPPGTASVAVDLPGKFRLTGLPVTW